MALRKILEGTPASYPVQAFNPSAPIYWEAGAVAMLDNTGHVVVSDGTTGAIGILADRRNTTVGIANATFLPSNPGSYGDESLFNQPGYGNSLYGVTGTTNNVIPANTIPTTTLLRDETAANPNVGSRYVTVYIIGGIYSTDQYDTAQTYVAGQTLYADTVNGRLTNVAKTFAVGQCNAAPDGNGLLQFKLTLV
jgi:hypothetical protein